MEIYLCLTILLAVFFILAIVWHAIQVKKRNKSGSFMTMEIIFVMLILLGMLIVNITALDYEKVLDSAESYSHQASSENDESQKQTDQSNGSDLISNLISMQANTLSVTAIMVTISCIIISILIFYRERKTEINSQKVETSLRKLKKTETVVQDIAAISSVLLLNDNEKDFFISIVKREIDQMRMNKKEPMDIATAHYQMIMLNMILDEQYYMPKNPDDMKKFDIIIDLATEIIENEEASHLSVYFAHVERTHAAFQKLKTSTDTDELKIEQIKRNIKSAINYARYLNKINDDSGNIQNLMGLIELWTGIAKYRINDIVENGAVFAWNDCLKHYQKALDWFNQAYDKNKNKKEFINQQIVAHLRISDVCDDSTRLKHIEDAKKLCENIIQKHNNYIKPHVNLADAIIRELRIFLNPEWKWNGDIKRHIYDYSKLAPQGNLDVQVLMNQALTALGKAADIDSNFANSHYKLAELNFSWLGYNMWLNSNNKASIPLEEMKQISKNCKDELETSIKLIGETAKIKGYKASLALIDKKLQELKKHNTQKLNNKKRKSLK